jgi:hypothetical protein
VADVPGGLSLTPPQEKTSTELHRGGADKSLDFPASYFHICSTSKRIFLGCVKKVRKNAVINMELGGGGEYVE